MSEIVLVVESRIKPGKSQDLRDLLGRLLDHMQKTEPDCVGYDWYFSDDEKRAVVIERYANSEAVIFHGQNYLPFLEELDTCREVYAAKVFGEPSDALTQGLKDRGAEIMTSVAALQK